MSTAEAIFEKAKALPDERQLEALHYLNFLILREHSKEESEEWAVFSANQLANQYGPDDAVYDQD